MDLTKLAEQGIEFNKDLNYLEIDIPSNRSMIFFHTGQIYEGETKGFLLEGQGKLTNPNGTVYEGEFRNSKYHGKGRLTRTDGLFYEGGFKEGKFHGEGKLTIPYKLTYKGQFRGDKFDGNGELHQFDGLHYKGQFKAGEFHGEGELKSYEGKYYKGSFKENKKNGEGKFKDDSGVDYEGSFKDDVFHGNGKLTLRDGSVYYLEFNDGLLVNPYLPNEKKDQTVMLINHYSTFDIRNFKRLSNRYKNVKLLQRGGIMNANFFKSLITLPTKGIKKAKKLKFSILEHAYKNGDIDNELFILEALNDTLKEVKNYNTANPKNEIKNIDIVLNTCYGSQVVYKNKRIHEALKKFTRSKIKVKISASDEKFETIDIISNSKNVFPFLNRRKKKNEKYVINEFEFKEESDFDTITPSKVKEYSSALHFLNDDYDGKKGKTDVDYSRLAHSSKEKSSAKMPTSIKTSTKGKSRKKKVRGNSFEGRLRGPLL